jgi:hypothetical protein
MRHRLARLALLTVTALVVLSATGTAAQSSVARSGVLSVKLVADHIAGPVVRGKGPVDGVVEVRRASGDLVTTVRTTREGFSRRVASGRYLISAMVADGTCRSSSARVKRSRTTHVTLACRDGLSTG